MLRTIKEKKSKVPKRRFSPEEDELIIKHVENGGAKNWRSIAEKLTNRSAAQVRERYVNYLDPNITHRPWTDEEELLLIKCVKEIGSKWTQIASYFEKRTDVNVRNHWISLSRENSRCDTSMTRISPHKLRKIKKKVQSRKYHEEKTRVKDIQKQQPVIVVKTDEVVHECPSKRVRSIIDELYPNDLETLNMIFSLD